MRKLIWKIDLLIYRLFYWRWSPRLRNDPDLAYLFSKIGAAWTNAHPPKSTKAVDKLIEQEFARHGKPAIRTDGTVTTELYFTIK